MWSSTSQPFLTLAETEWAFCLAPKLGRCLAEVTAFDYHPQFTKIEHYLTTYGPLNCVSAQFNILPLPAGNFRKHAALGGGCLADMGLLQRLWKLGSPGRHTGQKTFRDRRQYRLLAVSLEDWHQRRFGF